MKPHNECLAEKKAQGQEPEGLFKLPSASAEASLGIKHKKNFMVHASLSMQRSHKWYLSQFKHLELSKRKFL